MGRSAMDTVGNQDIRLLSLSEAAARLATTTRTIQRLIERGVLIRVQLPGVRRTLVAERDLIRLIDEGQRDRGPAR
jgi:excisionase family DNA binding protein